MNPITHHYTQVNGMRVFYREAGPKDAPVLLLPHGYPCSSFQYRNLMPALADRWRLIAPDFPGFGYSGTPDDFDYSFDGYAALLNSFAESLQLDMYSLYLHDYGSQIGLRLAMHAPEKVSTLVIQNGDIYEDALGPKYDGLKEYWQNPSAENHKKLEDAVSEDGFRKEFIGETDASLHSYFTPDLWTLATAQLLTPKRQAVMVGLMEGLQQNLEWMPKAQAYLHEHQPPTLIVWGPQDGYMPEKSARAYLRDIPNAELHLLDGGHWLLETHIDEVLPLLRNFLEKHAR